MEIYVIRHTPVKVEKDTCYGQSDVQLADTFQKDIQYYLDNLPSDFDIVYCSPLSRCKKVAKALKLENIIYEKSLMEMNFGDWESKKWDEIEQKSLQKWMNDFVHTPAPQGENLSQVFHRVELFMNLLRKRENQKVLLITHAGIIRCLWAYLLQIPLESIFKLPVNYQEIFIFHLGKNETLDMIKRTC